VKIKIFKAKFYLSNIGKWRYKFMGKKGLIAKIELKDAHWDPWVFIEYKQTSDGPYIIIPIKKAGIHISPHREGEHTHIKASGFSPEEDFNLKNAYSSIEDFLSDFREYGLLYQPKDDREVFVLQQLIPNVKQLEEAYSIRNKKFEIDLSKAKHSIPFLYVVKCKINSELFRCLFQCPYSYPFLILDPADKVIVVPRIYRDSFIGISISIENPELTMEKLMQTKIGSFLKQMLNAFGHTQKYSKQEYYQWINNPVYKQIREEDSLFYKDILCLMENYEQN
jgi:hypothetical protein